MDSSRSPAHPNTVPPAQPTQDDPRDDSSRGRSLSGGGDSAARELTGVGQDEQRQHGQGEGQEGQQEGEQSQGAQGRQAEGPPPGAEARGDDGVDAEHRRQDQHQLLNGAAAPARKAQVVLSQPIEQEDASEDERPRSADGDADNGDFLADFPDDTPELELVHCRLSSCSTLHLPRFAPYLKKLCLRQNHISELDPTDFDQLRELEELDLYDNQLKHVSDGLKNSIKLQSLDLSFNLLRSVPASLAPLAALKSIYFVQNKITRIDNLASFSALKSLELGGNRIREIENLDALVNLEELWLGKNKISKLENLSALAKLRILSIQSNRITKLEGLDELAQLQELYISHNGVERLEGLEHNTKLRTLDVGTNKISRLENLGHLTELEELWANDNNIATLADLTPQLGHLASLTTLYLERNPAQRDDAVAYRRKVMLALPQVQQIDATSARP